MAKNPYQYDDVAVFVNKLGLRDPVALDNAEKKITFIRGMELLGQPILGTFDSDHLARIHHHLFQDVYGWAGKFRTLPLSKRTPDGARLSHFADAPEIADIVNGVAVHLAATNHFRGLQTADLANELTEVQARYNFAHPFPEGNGRATQSLLRQLANIAGHELHYDEVNKTEWAIANALAMPHLQLYDHGRIRVSRETDRSLLADIFNRIVRPMPPPTNAQDLAERAKNLFIGTPKRGRGSDSQPT